MVIVYLLLSFQYEYFYGELRRRQKGVGVVREIRNVNCVKLRNGKMQNGMCEIRKSLCVKLEKDFWVCMNLETCMKL